jgi:hypothetical protein
MRQGSKDEDSGGAVMETPLVATLRIGQQKGLWAHLRIENHKDEAVEIFYPEDFPPHDGWAFSREAYQVALLQSFHILMMKLMDADQAEINQQTLATMADPAFRRVTLQKGQTLALSIPLHEFYRLERGGRYTLILQYGRDLVKAHVENTFEIE